MQLAKLTRYECKTVLLGATGHGTQGTCIFITTARETLGARISGAFKGSEELEETVRNVTRSSLRAT